MLIYPNKCIHSLPLCVTEQLPVLGRVCSQQPAGAPQPPQVCRGDVATGIEEEELLNADSGWGGGLFKSVLATVLVQPTCPPRSPVWEGYVVGPRALLVALSLSMLLLKAFTRRVAPRCFYTPLRFVGLSEVLFVGPSLVRILGRNTANQYLRWGRNRTFRSPWQCVLKAST